MRVFLSAAISVYVIIHFLDFFLPNDQLRYLLSTIGFLVLFFALIYTRFKNMMLPFCLTISAVIILAVHPEPISSYDFERSFTQMRSLIGLLFIVPMVSWVLRYEPYIEEMIVLFQKQLHQSKRFYVGLTFMTQIISYFLIVGTIPVLYQVLHTMLKERREPIWETFKAAIIIRGFALASLWVISVPSFSYAVQSTGTMLHTAILQGALVSFFGMMLAAVILHVQERRKGMDFTKGIQEELQRFLPNNRWNKRLLLEFLLLFVTLVGFIFLLHLAFHIEILVAIPIVIVVWTFVYFLIKRDLYRLITESKFYLIRGVPLKAKEISLILSAGFLIHALNKTGLGSRFIEAMYELSEKIASINFLTILPFIVIILGFVGLSPLTVMVLLGEIIRQISLPYPPDLLLLSLTLGSCLTIMLSPLGIPVIVLSSENKRTPLNNSLKMNWRYACCFYVIVQLYIQIRCLAI